MKQRLISLLVISLIFSNAAALPSQLGTIPPVTEPSRQTEHQLYFPHIDVVPECATNMVADKLEQLMRDDAQQERPIVLCDKRLVIAAQRRAEDMVHNRYFSHVDLSGHQANWWAIRAGCNLPTYYTPDGNNIESIGLNFINADDAWAGLKLSPPHRNHILGIHPFFKKQIYVGTGYAESTWGRVYVILSSEAC